MISMLKSGMHMMGEPKWTVGKLLNHNDFYNVSSYQDKYMGFIYWTQCKVMIYGILGSSMYILLASNPTAVGITGHYPHASTIMSF